MAGVGHQRAGIILASTMGIAVATAIWWTYFDVTAVAAERELAAAPETERPRLARDAYSYLHLPMIAGIVLAALGIKKVLGYVGEADGHDWSDSLHGVSLIALHGGPALFFFAMVAFRLRVRGTVARARLTAGLALCAAIPLGAYVGALLDLVLVCAITVALIVFEATKFAETRDRIRHARHE